MEYLNVTREPSPCPTGLRTGRYVQNGTTYKYVYNGGQLMQMTKGSQTVSFAYDVSGTPLTMKVGENTYYYVTNIQGDVMALVGSNGQTVVSYAYTAYGVVTASGDATVIALNPLTYRGYVYDTETGLYYLQSRYYDPAVGRFINADVYTTTGQGFIGNNMFAYCGNNPVNRVDPSGYSYEDPITEEEWAIYNLAELLKALVENGAAWFAILMCRPICPVDAYRNTDTDARYGAPRSHGPHEGIDYYPSDSVDNAYNGGDGTPQPVRAMNDGYILSINKKYYGNTMSVKIDHGTYIAEYCEIQLSEAVYDAWTGDRYISQGEVIGTMLQTSSASCSWTIMLHLEITYKGKKINPTIAYYFKKGEYTK